MDLDNGHSSSKIASTPKGKRHAMNPDKERWDLWSETDEEVDEIEYEDEEEE